MKWILPFCLIYASAFADQSVSVFSPNSNGMVLRGCKQVIFILYSGNVTIGSAPFTGAPKNTIIPISSIGNNEILRDIPYTIESQNTLKIVEVR